MDTTVTAWYLAPAVRAVRNRGITACENKAQEIFRGKTPTIIGGGKNLRWPLSPSVDVMQDSALDFNTKELQFERESQSHVVCEQVIEHLHNTLFFCEELFRILRWKGELLISSENLASIPNLFALLCGMAPFSTQATCGHFIGGWKSGRAGEHWSVPKNHPAHAGITGHVRVMTKGQMRTLLEFVGFTINAVHTFGFNHYMLFHCSK